ncbi:MAG: hypothetical protein CMJ58_08345 [Planctomycetaceae bacterium]|nr:hypothetical protein [Planctomycetaceae bacterium]
MDDQKNQVLWISPEHLRGISFPDCEVVRFEFSASRLFCQLSGIHVENTGMIHANVQLIISGWTCVSVQRFDSNGIDTVDLELAESGSLKDICEWRMNGSELSFAGFEENSGLWQLYRFEGGTVQVGYAS